MLNELTLTMEPAEVIFIIGGIIVGIGLLVLYVRNKNIDNIRDDVYQLFLKAEHLYEESGAGEEKMNWVVDNAYALLPVPIRLLVTPAMLKTILQKWFKSIKDLLDDGKINKSVE